MSDRTFTIALNISLGLHLALLAVQFLPFGWLSHARPRGPLEVVYDYEVAQQALQHLQAEVARATTEAATNVPSPSPVGGGQPQIRIPDRPVLALTRNLPDTLPGYPVSIDLTNLAEAARGDPVLLSYFSAIREQIQQAANRRGWVTDEPSKGLVYVSFVLSSNGAIRDTSVISGRSASSTALQGVALRIIETAAPFPPFPPSINEPRKTIVVPLEFLLGS